MTYSPSYGAIVGRFQVHRLHTGHLALIKAVLEKHAHLLIVLGVPRTPLNATNPLSYDARRVMLETTLRTEGVHNFSILRQSDERYDHIWSKKLDIILEGASNGNVTLYTGRDGFASHYHGKFEVKHLDLKCDTSNATSIREAIVQVPSFESEDFRAGQIYAMNTKHFQTYCTVDMAMLHNTGHSTEILLCRKPNETAWRFPGGFIEEALNETFAQAAAREMREETDLVSETGWTIVKDYPIPDEWRLRKNKGVSHRTILLYGYCMTKNATAQDDIAEVKWFDLKFAMENAKELMMQEHRVMMLNDMFKSLTK